VRFKDDATADELREEVMRRLGILAEAGVIDLQALPVPKAGIANQPISGDQLGLKGGVIRTLLRTVSISATRGESNCVNRCGPHPVSTGQVA
jgi:hypothetical protein